MEKEKEKKNENAWRIVVFICALYLRGRNYYKYLIYQ
jgi:hypothetical protein